MNKYPNYSESQRDKFLHNFDDRGMIRWFGFYLSDHSAALHQDAIKRNELFSQKHHQKMNFSVIAHTISYALVKNYKIKLEKNTTDLIDGELIDSAPIEGYITGFTEHGLVVNQKKISFNEIKSICILKN
ncbi:MAG: hypothetical protein M3Z38_05390 [Bombilactobacillus mellifer]|nr:hypothetical protein [Bombilactobacillus mellifer]